MQRGLDWYKRDPIAFLGGVQGLTAKQIAVYTVALDLIYQHGGSVHNDPGWIAGWVSDMGQSSVRKTLSNLIELGKLSIDENGDLTQKRAKTVAKTQQNLRETRQKTGRKGGENSAKIRSENNKNNDLEEASASNQNTADKNRGEKIREERTPSTATQSLSPTVEKLKNEKGKVVFDAGRWFTDQEVENLENRYSKIAVSRKLNDDGFRLWCFKTNEAQPKLAATNVLAKENLEKEIIGQLQNRPKSEEATSSLLNSSIVKKGFEK